MILSETSFLIWKTPNIVQPLCFRCVKPSSIWAGPDGLDQYQHARNCPGSQLTSAKPFLATSAWAAVDDRPLEPFDYFPVRTRMGTSHRSNAHVLLLADSESSFDALLRCPPFVVEARYDARSRRPYLSIKIAE